MDGLTSITMVEKMGMNEYDLFLAGEGITGFRGDDAFKPGPPVPRYRNCTFGRGGRGTYRWENRLGVDVCVSCHGAFCAVGA